MRETEDGFSNPDNTISVSKSTAGTRFVTDGKIGVAIVADNSKDGTSHVSIYGDSAGLLALADLFTAFALLNQENVADRNCPNGEGVHTTLDSERGLATNGVELHLGRLDAKGTKELEWFLKSPAVTIETRD